MTGPPDDWLSEADLDALVDAGQIDPVAEAPVAKLAKQVVTQLERTLGGLDDAMEDVPWKDDVEALEHVRTRIERLSYVGEQAALPPLDQLLRMLDRAGQHDFVARLRAWCDDVDRMLGERR